MHQLFIMLDAIPATNSFNVLFVSQFIDDVFLLDKLARGANILSSLKLVASQHPNLDVGSLHIMNDFRNTILQTILDGSRPNQC